MRVLFFGTYDADRHPRVRVLREGFDALGDEVLEINEPLRADTDFRVRLLRAPWLLPLLAVRLAVCWFNLWRRSRGVRKPDAVVVGYMGQFDVHLARWLFRGVPIVLDLLVTGRGTASDRGSGGRIVRQLVGLVDDLALRAADLVCVDTAEHLAVLPEREHSRAVVVPVGAPTCWFEPTHPPADGPMRVVFFGLYTPLQGAPVIGAAIADLVGEPISFTMIGTGQEYERTRRLASPHPGVRWIDRVEPSELPATVAVHHVCLGIFGTTDKARRVVPNKVFQGAAAGCAVLTSDTPPQRRLLQGAATLVPPGDAKELAEALRTLAADRARLAERRHAAARWAEAFRPETVVTSLRTALLAR